MLCIASFEYDCRQCVYFINVHGVFCIFWCLFLPSSPPSPPPLLIAVKIFSFLSSFTSFSSLLSSIILPGNPFEDDTPNKKAKRVDGAHSVPAGWTIVALLSIYFHPLTCKSRGETVGSNLERNMQRPLRLACPCVANDILPSCRHSDLPRRVAPFAFYDFSRQNSPSLSLSVSLFD